MINPTHIADAQLIGLVLGALIVVPVLAYWIGRGVDTLEDDTDPTDRILPQLQEHDHEQDDR